MPTRALPYALPSAMVQMARPLFPPGMSLVVPFENIRPTKPDSLYIWLFGLVALWLPELVKYEAILDRS